MKTSNRTEWPRLEAPVRSFERQSELNKQSNLILVRLLIYVLAAEAVRAVQIKTIIYEL